MYDFSQEEEFLAQVVPKPTPDPSVLPIHLDPTAGNPAAATDTTSADATPADATAAGSDVTAADSAAKPADSAQPHGTSTRSSS